MVVCTIHAAWAAEVFAAALAWFQCKSVGVFGPPSRLMLPPPPLLLEHSEVGGVAIAADQLELEGVDGIAAAVAEAGRRYIQLHPRLSIASASADSAVAVA